MFLLDFIKPEFLLLRVRDGETDIDEQGMKERGREASHIFPRTFPTYFMPHGIAVVE